MIKVWNLVFRGYICVTQKGVIFARVNVWNYLVILYFHWCYFGVFFLLMIFVCHNKRFASLYIYIYIYIYIFLNQ